MKELFRKLKKIHYFHYVNILITLGFLALTLFYFDSVFIRFKESFRDLILSVGFYLSELFETDWGIFPTVNVHSEVPFTPIFGLPATWEEFQLEWNEYWALWISKENFQGYFEWLGNALYSISKVLLLI